MTKWKDITSKERKHLQEQGITTLREFKVVAEKQAEDQREMQKQFPHFEPCWDCRMIAKKLELGV